MENSKRNRNACPYVKKCGGCDYSGKSYTAYLREKQETVNKLLQPFLKDSKGSKIEIIGMENPFHYRHKVNAAFARKKDGTIISGVYQEGTHEVVNIDSCFIENQVADSIICDVKRLLKSFKVRIYDEDRRCGLLRHVMVRTGRRTGQVMLILVVADPIFPSKNNFVKAIRKLHPEISTVVLNVNDKNTSMVLGKRDIVIYGKGKIEDELCGIKYDISPQSFFQVNPEMTEKIYETAIEFADLKKCDRVIDAYCGIGTIGLTAARYVKEVIGVELNRDAVRDAVSNAKKNAVKNAVFYQGDAGDFMVDMASKNEKCDVLFMDPPRSGSTEKFIQAVHILSPERIVYISCNPETLARDLKNLAGKRYQVEKIVGFDQFPWTGHVETVCLLSNRKPDTKVRIDVDLEDYYRIKDAKKNQN